MMREGRTEKITLGFAGAITAFSSLFTYGILSEFQGISIRKIFAEHEIIDNMLQNGQIDFAITFPPLTGKNIESRILVHDTIQLAVAGGHPLLKQFTIHLVVAIGKKVRGDGRGIGSDAVERIVDVGFKLPSAEFPQTVGRNKERAVKKSPSVT